MAEDKVEQPDGSADDARAASTVADEPRHLDTPELEDADGDGTVEIDPASAVDLLGDVDLDVKIELGRCRMQVGDVLRLQPGSVVELDKLAGDPVDVYVNERLVARGEVLVVNDNFCVRVNEVLSADADND